MPRRSAKEALLHPRMRGKTAAQFRPFTPEAMVRACRKLASDMRREAALGWPPVVLWDGSSISRAEAAASMDRRGDEWAKKATR
jgi:hypothetical protein